MSMKVIHIKSCENCPNIRQGSKWEYCHLNSSQSHLLKNYIIPEWCPLDEDKESFNLKELTAEWEEFFYDSVWNPDTLNLTPFEKKLIDELTGSLPRHMAVYDWNLPYAEGIILIIRRAINKEVSGCQQ